MNNAEHEIVTWQEDITHDGIPDKIEVDISLANAVGENLKGNEETLRIYSGKTGEKIWSGHADTIHAGWNGFYLYRNPENKKAYILNWRPVLYQGNGQFFYQIFSLTEQGERQIFTEEKLEFKVDTMTKEETEQLNAYLTRLNGYLENSFLLIDTNEGNVRYSPQGRPMTKPYRLLS